MRLTRLYFRNVRNHVETELRPTAGVNVFTGYNGAGKTSILEAISLCTLTRSFVGRGDSTILKRGATEMVARLEGISDYEVPRRIQVTYSLEAGKNIELDGSPAARAADVIGAAPTIVLSPDLKGITAGPPSERRRFLDTVLSQAKRRYLDDLIDYRRLLRQRNALLTSWRKSGRSVPSELMEPWNEGLVERGASIMAQRAEFMREFQPIVRRTDSEIAMGADEIQIGYQPDGVSLESGSLPAFRDALWLRSKEVAEREFRRGTTLFGPHRDDFAMEINGGDVRDSASQGQHKTLLIGLKVAEFHYLKEQTAETPLILLDDIFGELDRRRAERVYEIAGSLAQVFITVVSLDLLPFLRETSAGATHLAEDGAEYVVREGQISS